MRTLDSQTPVAKWADALTRIKMENPDWSQETCLLRLTADAYKKIDLLESRVKSQTLELLDSYRNSKGVA